MARRCRSSARRLRPIRTASAGERDGYEEKMVQLPYIVTYAAFGVFLLACVARVFMWAKMPLHVRWELYPVAHEGDKAHYGGSYLEESEWWTKPRHVSLFGELKVMVPEILFLVALKEHNPKMWLRSFPFHFGLYLAIAATALALLAGVVGVAAPGALAGAVGATWQTAVVLIGVAGVALGLIGALALLQRRLGTPELRDYSSGADIFNLLFFVLAFGSALLTFLLVDLDGARAMAFARNLVSLRFDAIASNGLAMQLPTLTVVLLGALIAYVPLTHMSHFIGKYFAYHAIRWNDTPNLPGSKEEATIRELLGRPVSWAAPLIAGDGKKTWAEVATKYSFPQEKK
jgi:nitrate reductase gamma subunit